MAEEAEQAKKAGIDTAALGAWVAQKLSSSAPPRYQLYYDHGPPTSSHVAAIKGIFGESVRNENRLADIDLLIATPEGEAVLLLELEERASSPKKLLGDVFALLMCNRIAVKKGKESKYFAITTDTQVLVAGVIEAKGQKRAQLENIIEPRLHQFTPPKDAIPTQNVRFLFEPDIRETVDALKANLAAFLKLDA